MDVKRAWGLSIDELERAVKTAAPDALLVPPRILRRVIKHTRRIPGPGLRVPHRKTFVVDRQVLLAIAEPGEMGIDPATPLPERVLLLARPDAERLASMTRLRALVKYWRLLFHARVHATLDARIRSGVLTPQMVLERIRQLGDVVFDEARAVLRHDEFLVPREDELGTYVEFCAVYLELRYFAAPFLPDYFPSVRDFTSVDELVGADIDGAALYAQTRLPGAGEPVEQLADVGESEATEADEDAQRFAAQPRKESERVYCRLMQRADGARQRGNVVRSALLRTQAALFIRPKVARAARLEALADIGRLVDRLSEALDLAPAAAREWTEALAPLVHPSGAAFWTAEARLLYDLQKVCVDHERGVYKIDLWRWLRTLGRRPLRRPLASQREVLMSKHLRAANSRLRSTRLSPAERRTLGRLLEGAMQLAERRVREQLRPRIVHALDAVNLRPTNLPESVARQKLVEELLDQVVDRGFVNMGDLRDAVSRNNLKIGDVGRPRDFVGGDQLMRVDRHLASALDGVYRGGEIYLRISQAIGALAFGTRSGRFLTKFVFVPYGGTFVALFAVLHMIESVSHDKPASQRTVNLLLAAATFLLGTFVLGLIHNAHFRRACAGACRAVYRGARWLAADLPRKLLGVEWVRRLFESDVFKFSGRYVLKPAVFTGLIMALRATVTGGAGSLVINLIVFAGVNILLNSRIGRDVDELVTDLAVRAWHQLRFRVLASFFKAIVDAFHQALELFERTLYAVDEWLRFRRGERPATVAFKIVFGALWSAVTYVARFVVTLLVEPQVNPIKHFPVVTVSHKLMITVGAPYMAGLLRLAFDIPKAEALGLATFIGTLIPGIFGFLVWELKENWRLYAANRPATLRPVIVGRHGETMTRLLRPGFHSGTLAKLYHRLRKADRKAYMSGRWQATRRYRESIDKVRESIGRAVQRELITLLDEDDRWSRPLELGEVQVGLRTARFELRSPDSGESGMWIELVEQSGWMVARTIQRGWSAQLGPDEAVILANALAGFFAMSDVEIIDEEVRWAFAHVPVELRYDEDGLAATVRDGAGERYQYTLSESSEGDPLVLPQPLSSRMPAPPLSHLLFSARPVKWRQWLPAWSEAPAPVLLKPEVVLHWQRGMVVPPAVA